jgi:hypothetical protein
VQEQANDQEPQTDHVVETTIETEAPAVDAASAGPAADAAVEEPSPKPMSKSKSTKMLDMPTTTKVVEQVSCQACGKSMSAKNLKYAHPKYCTERNQEEKPAEIPIPAIEIKNAHKSKTSRHYR